MWARSTPAAISLSPGAGLFARPIVASLVALAAVTAVRASGTVDSDVAWQLWIAGRIHAGANLYRDIIETNPPLWFWMAEPVDRVAALLHVRIEPVLVVAIGVAIGMALVATDRLTRHVDPRRRTLLLGYVALALAAMPWMHVGQREQIALIGAVPYAALIAARRERREVQPALAIAVGAGAALAFALKHYFLIVPLLLELWLVAGMRKRWRPLRPETVAILSVGAAYATAILLLEPDFLSRILPLLNLAYGVFGAPSIRYLFSPFGIVGMVLLGALAANWRRIAREGPFAAALLVASIGFAAAYFIQFKGWPYHAIPMIGCASVGLAAFLAESSSPSPPMRLLAPALLLLPLALAAEEQMNPALPSPDLLDAISGLQPGETVGFLTTETAIPWSVTLQHNYRYASRYNGFWMMRAIVANEAREAPDPRLVQLGRQIVSETVDDFTCTPPRRIMVTRPRPGEPAYDILPFFLRDAHFAQLLSHYRVRSRTSLETYELVTPLGPPRGPCRQGV